MKKMIFLAILLMGFQMLNSQLNPKRGKAVDHLLGKIARVLEKKYHVDPFGTSIAMPGGVVKKLGLDFQIIGPLSREEARKILIEISQKFLLFVNDDEAVRPFLVNYPFEIKNIDIGLFFVNKKRI